MGANGYRGIRKKRDNNESVRRFEATPDFGTGQIDILEYYIHKQIQKELLRRVEFNSVGEAQAAIT